ncbi:ROK family protein, partial [Streptomyces sp. MK5]|uniref:ROK family protein n=1 Tax=Streptomyces sp. MK5 TaxID=3064253 RepID=UPI0035561FD3
MLIEDNTRLAALTETIWGAAVGEQDLLYLRLSHGIGGGLVVAGTLPRGPHGRSGEFGHVTVEPDGRPAGAAGPGAWRRWPRSRPYSTPTVPGLARLVGPWPLACRCPARPSERRCRSSAGPVPATRALGSARPREAGRRPVPPSVRRSCGTVGRRGLLPPASADRRPGARTPT